MKDNHLDIKITGLVLSKKCCFQHESQGYYYLNTSFVGNGTLLFLVLHSRKIIDFGSSNFLKYLINDKITISSKILKVFKISFSNFLIET